VVAGRPKPINYRHLSGPTEIDFRAQCCCRFSKGKRESRAGRVAIRIQAQFDKLERATRFGPEFLTYVLSGPSRRRGVANNLGEVLVEGSKASSGCHRRSCRAFALIVTAEPYFAVTQPSEVWC